MSITDLKKQIRTTMIKMRFDMDANQKRTYDNEICNQLEQIVATNKCKVVHAYIPMAAEIDIKPLLQKMLDRKVTVVCPKALPKRKLENRVLKSFNELETGVMGTQHPLERDIYSVLFQMDLTPMEHSENVDSCPKDDF